VVGGDSHMGRSGFDQREDRIEHAPDGANLLAVNAAGSGHGEVVAEELVGSVDEVYFHGKPAGC
jgi:hypothetical protein